MISTPFFLTSRSVWRSATCLKRLSPYFFFQLIQREESAVPSSLFPAKKFSTSSTGRTFPHLIREASSAKRSGAEQEKTKRCSALFSQEKTPARASSLRAMWGWFPMTAKYMLRQSIQKTREKSKRKQCLEIVTPSFEPSSRGEFSAQEAEFAYLREALSLV